MKKYIFAALTFVSTLILAVALQVYLFGGIVSTVLMLFLIFSLTIYVYNRIKNMEPALDADNREGQLSENEKAMFERVFKGIDCTSLGIHRVVAGKSKNGRFNYTIVLYTRQGLFLHSDKIHKAIAHEFNKGQKIQVCLNTREEELEQVLKAVYRLHSCQSSSTSQVNPE